MQNDSDIISYATWSINNESPLKMRDKYHDESKSKSKKTGNEDENDAKSNPRSKTTTECCSFCCCLSFLTFKTCKFHNVITYMILLSFLALFMQMVQGGYLPAIMSSIQTQFNMSTSKIGFIVSSFDIMGIFATPIISYMGTRYNKCKLIGICGIFYTIGACIYTFPFFFGGKYVVKMMSTGLTSPVNIGNSTGSANFTIKTESNVDMCKINSTTLSSYLLSTSTSARSLLNHSTVGSITTVSSTNFFNLTSNETSSTCNRNVSTSWTYFLFIVAQLFMSMGSAPLFALGVTYLCDNTPERRHPLFTGIIYGALAFGPALGYVTASVVLAKWIYPNEEPPVTEKDPRWVGCWYPGILIAAAIVLVVSLVLMTFPEALREERRQMMREKRRMKKQNSDLSLITNSSASTTMVKDQGEFSRRKLEPIEETHEVVDTNFQYLENDETPSTSSNNETPAPDKKKKAGPSFTTRLIGRVNHSRLKFKGFLTSFLKLILNLRYTLLVIILSFECILVAAFTNYMVLYTQHVYQIPSSKSSIMVGGVVVPSAILGAILGGLIVKKFNLQVEGCVRLIIFSSIVVISGLFVLLFVKCDGPSSVGIDMNTQAFNTTFIDCNINCNCRSSYNPTCGADSISYVSPCYAGCKFVDDKGYFDCGCVKKGASFNSTAQAEATAGACSRNCSSKFIFFLVLLFVVITAESLTLTPATMCILNLIDKKLQPFALGVLRCANILIAYIPAPIVLSNIIDRTCLLWNNECIGDKGTCLEYNASHFHLYLFASSVGVKIASCGLLVILSVYIHKSYILRHKYRSRAKLNHDVTSVLSPKQKYRIDSIVASSADSYTESATDTSSSEDSRSIRERYLYKPMSRLRSSPTGSPNKTNNQSDTNVVLTKHTIFQDDISCRSQTPEFFLFNDNSNVNQIPTSSNTNDNNKKTTNV